MINNKTLDNKFGDAKVHDVTEEFNVIWTYSNELFLNHSKINKMYLLYKGDFSGKNIFDILHFSQ